MAERKPDDIAAAANVLRGGGLVAFPTETVYGLGADATNSAAVRRIFLAKGRPSTNPLIVHVADESAARRYSAKWPREAQILAEKFWPGPLTLVLPKSEKIVAEVTAGIQTVGLRVPRHPLALELLRQFDGAVAAPSANRSGCVSPTTAEHVRKELGDQVDLILDGGPCQVGIESTVLDLSSPRPTILRPGNVRREEIEAVIGHVQVLSSFQTTGETAKSPGMQAVHYSPKTPMFRFEAGQVDRIAQWRQTHTNQSLIVFLLAGLFEENQFNVACDSSLKRIIMANDPNQYARSLYSLLHAADEEHAGAIWVQMPPDEPIWAAIRDRLIRASNKA